MLGKKHLHIDENDQLGSWIGQALHTASSGSVGISFEEVPAVKIKMEDNRINVDLLNPEFLKLDNDDTGLMDKLKTASEFGSKLSENGVTISFLRNGKEAVRLGKDARPTLSKLITRSDDLQLTNAGEFAKLKRDLKTD